MANLTKQQFVYDVGGLIAPLMNAPVVAQRAPTTSDFALPGQIWIDSPNQAIYMLASITANSANWTTSPASGVGAFTSVTVNPGNVTLAAGNLTLALGNLALTAGNLTVGGDLTVAGTTTLSGDIDFTSALLIDVTSTLDAAPSILLQADGGTSEQIRLYSNQGTAVDSIYLFSNVGGITARADLASADAINLSATAGGVDIDGALQVNIASSQNAASALVLSASAGGIDITAAGSAGEDIDITNSASINLTSSEAVADAIVLNASHATGGVQIQAGSNGILIGNQADCSVISLGDIAATASRTVTIAGGTNVTAAVTDLVDIAPDGATTNADSVKQVNVCNSNVTTGQSIVNINGGTAASGTSTVNISTGTGGGTKAVNVGNADGLTTFNLDAITLINDSVNVNTSINTGTSTGVVAIGNGAAGAVTVDSGAGISLDGAAASNFSVSGAGIDLTLASAAGRVVVNGEEAAADALRLLSAAGGLDANVALQMNLDSSQAAADAIRIIASNAAGGIDIDCGTAGAALDSTGAVSLQGAAASDFSVSGAGIDLTLASAAGRVVVNGEEAAADAVRVVSAAGGLDTNVALQMNLDSSQAAADAVRIIASNAAGGIDMDCGTAGYALDSTGAISLGAAAASDFTVTGAFDLSLISSAGSVVINGGEAAVDAVRIYASNAAGGIDVDYGTGGMTVTGANGAYTLASGTGAINISADAATTTVNIATGAAVKTLTVGSTNGASATVVQSGTGALALSSGTGTRGLVSVDPAVATEAAGASSTVNSRVIRVIFQGITTASGADEDITITSSLITTSSALMCNVATIGGGNDADLTIEGVRQSAGNVVLHCINSGPAAVNTNVLVTVWVLS